MPMTPEELAAALREFFLDDWVPGPDWAGGRNPVFEWEDWIANDPERAWPVFLRLLVHNWDDRGLELIAFRLESLLAEKWDQFEARVRELLRQHASLRRVMPATALEKAYYQERSFSRDELVEAYFVLDAHHDRAHQLLDLARANPELALPLTLELINRLPAARLEYDAANWLLKTLLEEHGPAVIGKIESAAATSSVLRQALWRLWHSQRAGSVAYKVISPNTLDQMRQAFGQTTPYTAEEPTPSAKYLQGAQEELLSSWIEYKKEWWAYEHLYDLIEHRPHEAWDVILDLVARAPRDESLGSIGAGPLEDLLADHSPVFIDRVEQQAAADPRLRTALRNVSRRGMPEVVWERVRQATG